MERLSSEAEQIQRILPWIENKEDIINFIKQIPTEHQQVRIPLALSYFINQNDQIEENSDQRIETEALEIVSLLPDIPLNVIKNNLKELGPIENRKEVLIRWLLKDRSEIKWILQDLNLNQGKKRCSEDSVKYGDFENNETNIKIKIRKIDGSLEVVSSFKQELLSAPKKNSESPMIRVKKDIYVDSANSNLFPTFIPYTAVDVNPTLMDSKQQQSAVSSTSIRTVQQYDLIKELKDLLNCSEEKIKSLCNRLRVPTDEKPSADDINFLIEQLLDDPVIDLNDSDSNSSGNELFLKPSSQICAGSRPILKPATLIWSNNYHTQTVPSNHFSIQLPERDVHDYTLPQNHLEEQEMVQSKPAWQPIKPEFDESIEDEFYNNDDSFFLHLDIPTENDIKKEQDVYSIDTPNDFTKKEPEDVKKEPEDVKKEPEDVKKGPEIVKKVPEIQIIEAQPGTSRDFNQKPVEQPNNMQNKVVLYNPKVGMKIMEIFPDACPNFVKQICIGKNFEHFDDIVSLILSNENYPKRIQRPPSPPKEFDIEEQWETLKMLLPDADPTYLRCKCEKFGNNQELLNAFVIEAKENKSYPTMKEYLRNQKLMAQSKQYTTDFNVKDFVKIFPDPEKVFNDPSRNHNFDNYTHLYVCNFFQNRYTKLSVRNIRCILAKNKDHLLKSDNEMQQYIKKGIVIKNSRKQVLFPDPPKNIGVLQELAYLANKEEIMKYIDDMKRLEIEERNTAKRLNLMVTCQCCYDDEIMPKDAFHCPKGCVFCRNCLQKSCEVTLGDAKTDFKCLNDCPEEFTLQTLQKALSPKFFSKLAQKKALAEVKAAGINELEMCPFCDFASIPDGADKIFRCLNPDCMKESCRQCKEENHVPYKCDEIEKDADVKARVFVENKMTEALLRNCWKCSKAFFKEEGCNMMTCNCGARMCYICRQPVKDYSHFNGLGGDKFQLCPLYNDTNEFNKQTVLKAAQEAKTMVDPSKLKIDPSTDVSQHYKKRKTKLPVEPHIRLLQEVQQNLAQIQQLEVALVRPPMNVNVNRRPGHFHRRNF